MGISFSIPMDEAVRVSEQLRASGRVTRGRIGVQIGQVSKEVAESIGLSKAQGALVQAVEPGAPADKAGVEAGDIITRFDGRVVEKSTDLPRMVGSTKPGTKSTLTVLRRGSTKDLTVTIAEIEAEKPLVKTADKSLKPKGSSAAQSLGLMVSELTDAQKASLKIAGGVMIDAAADVAAKAGLREGDVIMQVGNSSVPNLKTFESVVAKIDKSKPVGLLIRRGDLAQMVVVRPAP
jgi:serine protease Do